MCVCACSHFNLLAWCGPLDPLLGRDVQIFWLSDLDNLSLCCVDHHHRLLSCWGWLIVKSCLWLPQVLGPTVFSMYMLPLSNVGRKHNIILYADDYQLYLPIKPHQADQLIKLETCLNYITSWTLQNVLILCTNKTEVIIVGPRELKHKISNGQNDLNVTTLASNNAVRNLGVVFNQALSFNFPSNNLSRTVFA